MSSKTAQIRDKTIESGVKNKWIENVFIYRVVDRGWRPSHSAEQIHHRD